MNIDTCSGFARPLSSMEMGRKSYLKKRLAYLNRVCAQRAELKKTIHSLEYWQTARTITENPRLWARSIKACISAVTYIACGVTAEITNAACRIICEMPASYPTRFFFHSLAFTGFLIFLYIDTFQKIADQICQSSLDQISAFFSDKCWIRAKKILDQIPDTKKFYTPENLSELSRRFSRHQYNLNFSSIICKLLSTKSHHETMKYIECLWKEVEKDPFIIEQRRSTSDKPLNAIWSTLSETSKIQILDRVFQRLNSEDCISDQPLIRLREAEAALIKAMEQQESSDQEKNAKKAVEMALRLHKVSLHPSRLEEQWQVFAEHAGYFGVMEPEFIRYTREKIADYQAQSRRPASPITIDKTGIIQYCARAYLMQPDSLLKQNDKEYKLPAIDTAQPRNIRKAGHRKKQLPVQRQDRKAVAEHKASEHPVLADADSIATAYPLELVSEDKSRLKSCISQITSFSAWEDKDHCRQQCSNWSIAGNRNLPIYHCSVGKFGSGKTLTLFYTRNGNNLEPIAIARHSKERQARGLYDIDSYFPGWQGENRVNLNLNFDFINTDQRLD